MKMIRKHLWNKKRTETLKVADLQGYLAQFERPQKFSSVLSK